MEPIHLDATFVSIYGLLIHDDDLKPKKKWLKKFFPDEVEEAEKKGKFSDSLLYDWKQQLYELTDKEGLYIADKPGDCLDYYLGIIPLFPWDDLPLKKHKTKEDGHKAIMDFLDKYFDLSSEELDKLDKKINYHNTVFMVTKGE